MATTLRGITWNHSRGFTSIVGVTQRYAELHPGTDIVWEKRSLSEFESKPIQELAETYDFLIIDHPWAGFAAKHNVLLPLNEYLPAKFLADQRENSVGRSFESYNFDGFQSALPIDAASPVAISRPDKIGADELPKAFDEVLELAKGGKVIYAATPTYLLMDFYGMCATAGGSLFDPSDAEHVVDRDHGLAVLEDMRALASLCPNEVFSLNTIDVHEALAASDAAVYCPWVYGYVNYSRRGYAAHPVKATNVPLYHGSILQGVLGGTGLAVSAKTQHVEEAANFVSYALSPEIQSTLYADNGGQPGHRAAWLDEECNRTTLSFFKDTLASLDAAYLRPRYSGYLHFQDNAGPVLHKFVQGELTAAQALDKLDEIYAVSRTKA
uniref:extracellular solute-binding protein n=1 Tax=Parolsenella massiliensis TaxID=1871022 RepID=UPI000933E98C|nr:extracellular solute-binding protein [Parolsenella massiliensis]